MRVSRTILALLLLTASVLYSCGEDTAIFVKQDVKENIIKDQLFEKTFYFDNGGELKLIQDENDNITFVTDNQYLPTINPKDNSLAFFPKINAKNLEIGDDGKLRFSMDLSYNSRNDLEEDISGSNITGRRLTDVVVSLKDNGNIVLKIKVFSGSKNDNPNFVDAERTLTGY